MMKTEYWLNGPVPDIPALLQPVAHALLQARSEVEECMANFPEDMIWQRPSGVASVAFHLQHLTGVLDRLFTYAKGLQLNSDQLNYLAKEGQQQENIYVNDLVNKFSQQIDLSIENLKTITPHSLTDRREVGRKQIPSTLIGLFFHAAKHTMRHTGQLIVTARILTKQ